ncbi:MAG: DUF4249 family protein [Candidatus Cloacimonadaceae bacterium]|nr:DUF4249 family protein [Candidatus Cloacimonadaceae bacterium]
MKYAIIIVILISLLILSCSDFTSKPRFEGDVFSIAGLLIAGRFVDLEKPVYVTRSSSIEDFDPMELFVFDATVTIREIDPISGDTLRVFALTPAFHEFKIKYIDPAENLILPEMKYRIEVTVPGYDKTIWAETTVPKQVEPVPDFFGHNVPGEGFSFDPDANSTLTYTTIDARYPLALNTGNEGGAYNFMSEMYCLEPFSTDLEFTTPVFGITNPDESFEDVYNSSGEGPRRIFILGRFTSRPQPDLPGNYLLVRDYAQTFVFYGRYRVSLYIVDDNYYNYSFKPEGYLYGGVRNALGYFGSASGGVMYATIVK